MMMETIIELENGIKSRASSKCDYELTLQSSGFQIVKVEIDEEAFA